MEILEKNIFLKLSSIEKLDMKMSKEKCKRKDNILF